MRIAVLGVGAIGAAVAKLLERHKDTDVLVLDADRERAERVAAELERGEARSVDVTGEELVAALREVDAFAACLPYRLNLTAMEAALAARCPYADLGGLYHMTLRQLELDPRFRDAGLPAIVGIGACPGVSNLLAGLAAGVLDRVHTLDIYDGAVDSGAAFSVPYSAETILDEFTLPAIVFEDGVLREVPAGSGAVRHRFADPVGEIEAVYTLHSELATLPTTIAGVRDVRWRLALPEGLANVFATLAGLGLGSTEPVETAGGKVRPRDVLLELLARLPGPTGPPGDVEALEIVATGERDGRPATFAGRALFEPQAEGIGGGAFGTAAPIAVAVRWLAEGRVRPGVRPPETALDPEEFLEALRSEGVRLTSSGRTR